MNSLFGSRKSLVGALAPVAIVVRLALLLLLLAAINETAVQNYATQMKQAIIARMSAKFQA